MKVNKNMIAKIKSMALTVMIISLCFLSSLAIQYMIEEDNALIPAIFVLGVFLTSVVTEGYTYGIIAALVSVLAVNFAFTFPFFRFDFSMPENIISAVILLAVTVITCGLVAKIKRQEAIKAESEKERMRANLLRAVSHDLKTPLTTIYGSASALIENYNTFTANQRVEMIGGIKEDAEWLMKMVENLLSVTRLDDGDVKIIKTNTALFELVDSVLQKLKKRYPNANVLVDIPDEFVFIPMDALLIEQVLLNLLENSVQHAKGMSFVSLKVFTSGDNAVFEIKDDGCGIDKEKLKEIFKGRYECESPFADGKKHSGIGLSVCASIIKAHGGEIEARSVKNGGALFKFSLKTEEV